MLPNGQSLKMFAKIASTFLYISFSNFVLGNNTNSQASSSICGLVNSDPVPYKTNSPINVNSTNVTFVGGPPLIIQNAFFSNLLFENKGNNFEVFPMTPKQGSTNGGIVCGRNYTFYKLDFYINPSLGRSHHTIDGKGAPLTCRIEFMDVKYGSFNESLKHRAGLIIFDFLINFTREDNPLFDPVQNITVALRKPGKQMILPATRLNDWLNELFIIHEYFAFLGSFVKRNTGTEYPAVINFVPNKIFRILSEKQFNNSFGSLQDKDGGKQNSTQPLQPTNGRRIYKSGNIAQFLTLY